MLRQGIALVLAGLITIGPATARAGENLSATVNAPGTGTNVDAATLATTSDEPEKTYARVMAAGIDYGTSFVLIEPDDILLPVAEATLAHLPVSDGATRTRAGVIFVSLAALAPDITYVFDDKTFTLSISPRPALLGAHHYGAEQPQSLDATMASRPPSAYLNYDVSASRTNADGYLETALSAQDWVLFSNESLQTNGPSERGQTFLAHDDPAHLRRFLAGDVTIGQSDALLGEIDVFGAGVQRAFEIDPYVATFPSPDVTGLLTAPGTADVYVNGLLTRTVPLAPGGYDISGIPVASGLSDVTVVVHDASGNARVYRQNYFGADSLLAPGLTDYSYGAGFLRQSYAGGYGRPGVAGTYRLGASDATTIGARVAATSRATEAEITGDTKIGAALVHVSEAVGTFGNASGTATNLGFSYTARENGISISSTLRSSAFGSLEPGSIPIASPRFEVEATASQQLARGSTLAASVFRQTFDTSAPQTTELVSLTQQLRDAQLLASVARSSDGTTPLTSYGVAFTSQVGRRGSLGGGTSAGSDARTTAAFQESAPSTDVGFGYGVNVQRAATNSSVLLDAVDHTPVADLTAYAQYFDGGTPQVTVGVSGGVVAVAGHVMPTRAVGGAFTIVDSGVGGIPVTAGGRPVGTTNRSGLLAIPSLGPYAPTAIDLDDTGTPLGIEVTHTEDVVAPGLRGGSIAKFDAKHLTYDVGTVLLGSRGTRAVPPQDSSLHLVRNGVESTSELDDRGAFYFENLVPGRYAATVRSGSATCSFTLDVPAQTGIANNLGTFLCAPSP